MEKEKVNICDVCDEKVASEKCNRCKTDLCRTCAKSCTSYFTNTSTSILNIIMCKTCKTKIEELLINDEKGLIVSHMNKHFVDITQKKEILNAIEKDE